MVQRSKGEMKFGDETNYRWPPMSRGEKSNGKCGKLRGKDDIAMAARSTKTARVQHIRGKSTVVSAASPIYRRQIGRTRERTTKRS